MGLQRPLIWFWGVAPAEYLPLYPVWLLWEEPDLQQFVVEIEAAANAPLPFEPTVTPLERRYIERTVRQRLHQPLFRERVLHAYGGRCSLCRLRHLELLDAAHIVGDAEGGEPVVPNGIAMCKIHHAAFDHQIFGIRPADYVVEVKPRVLEEEDGPTLRHALQEIHGSKLEVPRSRLARPDRDLLHARYETYLSRAG